MTDVTPRPKGKKPETPGQHKRACERLCREIVHARGHCEYAADTGRWDDCDGRLEWAHVIRRGRSGIFVDLDNARLLCHKHHTWLDNNEGEWAAWVGIGELRRLRSKAQQFTDGELGSALLFWRGERARLTELAKEMGLV